MTDAQVGAVPAGRRERKKLQMRRHISDTATGMFLRRGFEQVTVAEIAEAADVSKMTVFNYFPRKEDLYLDRAPEARALLVGAVREREPGEPPVAALRRLTLRLIDERHPLGAVTGGVGAFLRVVRDSPALSARWRETDAEAAAELAGALADADGRAPGDAECRYVADAVLALRNTLMREAADRTEAGEPADTVRPGVRALAVRLFALLEDGLGRGWGT